MIDIGSDFSGVGAFEQALMRLGIDYRTVFACDIDPYSRESYMANYGEPKYYPFDVYDRKIPKKSLDVYVTTPPCQAFSLAGKRKGEDDDRGVFFYNSHEFIVNNNPRFFIFENVKGLLSDDKKNKKSEVGRTFQIWLDMLGGKSVNGNPVIFPREDASPYHIYWKVLNAKQYGVPQNRERVFIIGIRDDVDNTFGWPKKQPLIKQLKDVLESNVDEKYYLSDRMINYLHARSDNFNNGKVNYKDENDTASCITKSSSSLDISDNIIKIGNTNKGEGIKVKSATKKGFEIAQEGDSINLSNLNSETRRGRIGKEIAQTLDTACNQAVMIGAFRGRNPDNPKSRRAGDPMKQRLELNTNGTSNTITSVQKDNIVVTKNYIQYDVSGKGYKSQQDRVYHENGVMCAIPSHNPEDKLKTLLNDKSIRRLTPRECFRLMDFPDSFKFVCSNSQLYKQAGNSIVVSVLVEILKKLNL